VHPILYQAIWRVLRNRVLAAAIVIVGCSACSSAATPRAATPMTSQQSTDNPCTWVSVAEVRAIVGPNADEGQLDPVGPDSCSYGYTSTTGVTTDVVVGPWPESVLGPIDQFQPAKRHRQEVTGLGDRATFFKTSSIDDGNSMIVVERGNRSLLLAGEFLTLSQAERLATLVLANWA
jgi:hypothetical protein